MDWDLPTAKGILAGAAVIVLAGSLAVAAQYGSKVAKSGPPWVSLSEYLVDKRETRADIKKGQIIAAWDRCISAKRMPGKEDLLDEYVRQLAELQAEYEALKGGRYNLDCVR